MLLFQMLLLQEKKLEERMELKSAKCCNDYVVSISDFPPLFFSKICIS